MSHETDLDKMLKELDVMYEKLKVDKVKSKFNDVVDKFERVRLKASQTMSEIDALLDQRDRLKNSQNGKDIMERKKIENKVEGLIDDSSSKLRELEMELKAQKKKPNEYSNIPQKEEMVNLMKERLDFLNARLNGEEPEQEEINDNRTALEKLNDIISKSNNSNINNRELNEIEKNKIEEWKKEMAEQDADLDEIRIGVKQLKNEARLAGEGIDRVGNKVKNLNKNVDKTQRKLNTQNQKLKDLINKIRTGDRFCVDILLVLIIIGLVMVLYSIIKHKF